MPELKEVFEMTTRQMEPDVDAWREQEKRQRRANRNKKIGAFAVAAAIGVAAIVWVLGPRGGQHTTAPLGGSVDATPEEVATDFVESYGAFQASLAGTYVAVDADISGLVTSVGASPLEGPPDHQLRVHISLLEAMSYEQMHDSCGETFFIVSDTVVRCTFDFHLLGSDEIGRGPFSGSYLDLTVRDGEIVRASIHWEIEKFSPQMWEPFADWVSTDHPKDAEVMYTDETRSYARLTEESIQLWEQHTRDYVKELGGTEGP